MTFSSADDLRLLLRKFEIPPPLAQGWCQKNVLLVQQLDASGVDQKHCGLSVINDDGLASAACALVGTLQEYGIFVVSNGALESWQPAPGLQLTLHKKLLLMNAFATHRL